MIKALAASTLLIAATALAGEPATAPARSGPDNEGDQIVCVNESVVGSRLARRRVCRTRSEWTELKAQERNVVDRVQRFQSMCGEAGGPGLSAAGFRAPAPPAC